MLGRLATLVGHGRAGVRIRLEWQEVGVGVGTGLQCSAASSRQHQVGLLVLVVLRRAGALTEGTDKTGTKKKRAYILDYAMHAQLVHGDGAQITQFCSRCRQMID